MEPVSERKGAALEPDLHRAPNLAEVTVVGLEIGLWNADTDAGILASGWRGFGREHRVVHDGRTAAHRNHFALQRLGAAEEPNFSLAAGIDLVVGHLRYQNVHE